MAANDNEPSAPLDALYIEARRHVLETRRCSVSDLQRTFQLGYNRASALVDRLIAEGVVTPAPDHLD